MNEAAAWSGYWAQMGEQGGCLPGAPPAVEAMLAESWRQFAGRLPEGGRLVDLATGTGAVLRAVGDAGRALDCVGVDYARLPTDAPAGLTLIGETRIEELPLEDASCDGIASQFGFEYAEREAAVAEIARVAKPGARLQLVIHHVDSPIVAQNRNRLTAIAACRAAALPDLARQALGGTDGRRALESAARDLAGKFPDQSVVQEIPSALDAAIAEESREMIAMIEDGMARETTILGELLRVAQDRPGIEALCAALGGSFTCDAPATLSAEGVDRPIAWLVTGRRNR